MSSLTWATISGLICLSSIVSSSQFYECEPPKEPSVYLTVSPIAKVIGNSPVERQLELNWINFDQEIGDWVGLFEYDPINASDPLIRLDATEFPGYYKSIIQFPYYDLKNVTDGCLGYWIAYIRENATVAKSCMRPQKQWMWNSRSQIGNFQLHEVFLPGVHNAGSYLPYSEKTDTIITRYCVCQDENVYQQLAYGIRYLDLRVAYYGDTLEKFWVNHDVYRFHPLDDVIDGLLAFVKESKDIVLVDIHRFPAGFRSKSRQKHEELVRYLEEKLNDNLVPRSIGFGVTLNEIWETNATIVLGYADRNVASSHPFLWPSIPQEWGDKQTVPSLKNYLEHAIVRRSHSSFPWAAMAQLTPTTFDILFRPGDGVRKLASVSNRDVTTWFRDEWWDKTSIAAVDFFHSTNIVDIAIEANRKRKQCIDRTWISKSEEPSGDIDEVNSTEGVTFTEASVLSEDSDSWKTGNKTEDLAVTVNASSPMTQSTTENPEKNTSGSL